jgi:ribonuclease/clavin/mitogillin
VTVRTSASLILMRPDGAIFWVQRQVHDRFLSGFWAFPGGMTEPGEAPEETAIRETQEEVGYRHLDAASLTPIGAWLVPPYIGAKLRTQFFLTRVDADCLAVVPPDSDELMAGGWIQPAEALALYARGEALIAPPTLDLLSVLAAGGADDVARFTDNPHARGVAADHSRLRPHIVLFAVRTPTLPPATHTNCYIVGNERLIVIDPASPFPKEQQRLAAFIDTLPGTVEAIALTHEHHDHVGGVVALAEHLGVPIWAHAEAAKRVDFAVDRHLEDGDVIDLGTLSLDVLHTPGHARGHLCYVDRADRSAIVGDMVAGLGTILIEPGDGDLRVYLDQLARLRDRNLSVLMPSHGPAMGGAHHTLQRYIDHRLMREAKVRAALDDGPLTVPEIVERAYADAPPIVRMGPGGGMAGLSVQTHLTKLIGDGVVAQDGDLFRTDETLGSLIA